MALTRRTQTGWGELEISMRFSNSGLLGREERRMERWKRHTVDQIPEREEHHPGCIGRPFSACDGGREVAGWASCCQTCGR
jgi:hypothetical protein